MKQLSLKEIQGKYAAGTFVSSAILRKLQRDPRPGARRLYKTLAKRYDDQKKELREIEDKTAADRKTGAAAKKDAAMSEGEK